MTAAPVEATAPTRRTRRSTAVRPEIQALRALAVMLVLLYHLWPNRLPGGFVGVDVFFVISGFLITSHLVRELHRTGTVAVATFWARRARRLLPASMLVLVVVLVATLVLVPDASWAQYLREIAASSTYVENWLLARDSVDYLAAEYSPSPVQHFWSLSVEEQFYLAWPLVLVAAASLTRAGGTVRKRVVGALVVVTGASLVVSIVWTAQLASSAYFSTFTRAWEFGAGALLALVPGGLLPLAARWRTALQWTGLAAIAVAAWSLSGATPFPGLVAALPVLGAVAVIGSGVPATRWSAAPLARLRPVQALGDVSYSVYLWHWPLVVLLPLLLGHDLTTAEKGAVLVASVGLGAVTKVLVEDPFRTSARLSGARPRWTFLVTAVSVVVVVAACGTAIGTLDARNAREAERVLAAAGGSCFGAAALDPGSACPDPFGADGSTTPAFAKTDTSNVADDDGGWQCETARGDAALRPCTWGDSGRPTRTVAMLGDSHAKQWVGPVREIAERRGWQVVTYFKSACSGTGATDVLLGARPDDQVACAQWGSAAIDAIAADDAVDTVIFSNVSSAYLQDGGSSPIGPERYADAWAELTARGKDVLVLRDVPRTAGGVDVPDCLAAAGADPLACTAPVAEAFPPDAMADAAERSDDPRVRLLDLTGQFCLDGTCHPRIGGVIVYSDASHVTDTYARTVGPYIEAALLAG